MDTPGKVVSKNGRLIRDLLNWIEDSNIIFIIYSEFNRATIHFSGRAE
jgi:hypothetical protein